MKSLNNYITEKFQVGKDYKRQYTYTPKDKDELIKCIEEKTRKEGFGTEDEPLNLNDIDTSQITDMSHLFDVISGTNKKLASLSKKGYFNISDWDVSKVTNMFAMFYCSGFNGDISDWNVSNVENMKWMFAGSDFEGDISNWNVSNVTKMEYMFFDAHTNKKYPPKWYKDVC